VVVNSIAMTLKIKLIIISLLTVTCFVFLIKYFYKDNQKNSRADTLPSIVLQLTQGDSQNIIKVQAKTTSTAVQIINYNFNVALNSGSQVTDIHYFFGNKSEGLGDGNENLTTVNSNRLIKINSDVEPPSPLSTTFQDIVSISFDNAQTGNMLSIPVDSLFAFTAYNSTTGESSALVITGGPFTLSGGLSSSSSSSTQSSSSSVVFSSSSSSVQSSSTSSSSSRQSSSSSAARSSSSSSRQSSSSSVSTPSPSNTPLAEVQVALKLRFQGIMVMPQNTTSQRVKVSLVKEGDEQDNSSFYWAEMLPGYDGTYKGTIGVDSIDYNAKYYIYVKGPKHLQKKFCDSFPQSNAQGFYSCGKAKITLHNGQNDFDFSNIKLLAGDLPEQGSVQNEMIDVYDLGIMRQYVPPICDVEGKKQDCTEAEIATYKQPALIVCDINMDNKIDQQDWSLILASMAVKYDEK